MCRYCAPLSEPGRRPWKARDVPSDHYIFAGEIPWHPHFASAALDEDAYREKIRIGTDTVSVEVLAHDYAWESYHSEMNRAGSVRVPSHRFSTRFDLCSAPQSFDQFLRDGTRATITLGGIDGFDADSLYLREDLLMQYAGERDIVWFAFGASESYDHIHRRHLNGLCRLSGNGKTNGARCCTMLISSRVRNNSRGYRDHAAAQFAAEPAAPSSDNRTKAESKRDKISWGFLPYRAPRRLVKSVVLLSPCGRSLMPP